MSKSTSEILLEKHAAIYKKATEHPLTKQLCQGTLSDKRLYIYIAQDLQFFNSSLKLICKTTSLAPKTDSLITLAKKIGFFANDENTYFQDCLKETKSAMNSKEIEYFNNIQIKPVEKYIDFVNELCTNDKITYAELITFLWICEQVYLQWAHYLPKKDNLHWKYQTWIDLHDGEHFVSWCDFLRNEVDNLKLNDDIENIFVNVVNLEFDFFESCFNAE